MHESGDVLGSGRPYPTTMAIPTTRSHDEAMAVVMQHTKDIPRPPVVPILFLEGASL